jgi:hypothetical protein
MFTIGQYFIVNSVNNQAQISQNALVFKYCQQHLQQIIDVPGYT